MSKPGLLRSLRDFFRELRSFGHSELDNLRVQARALQQELDELEAMRAARERQEEALAMMQVQNTVTNMQQLDKIVQKSEKLISDAVEEAGAKTDQQIKAILHQKAQEIVSKLDLEKAMSMDASPEQIIQDAMRQATVQLQSEGESLLNLDLPATPQRPSQSPAQGNEKATAGGRPGIAASAQHQQKRQTHQPSLQHIAHPAQNIWSPLLVNR